MRWARCLHEEKSRDVSETPHVDPPFPAVGPREMAGQARPHDPRRELDSTGSRRSQRVLTSHDENRHSPACSGTSEGHEVILQCPDELLSAKGMVDRRCP